MLGSVSTWMRDRLHDLSMKPAQLSLIIPLSVILRAVSTSKSWHEKQVHA